MATTKVFTLSSFPAEETSLKLFSEFSKISGNKCVVMTYDLTAKAKSFLSNSEKKGVDWQRKFESISPHATEHFCIVGSIKGKENDDFAAKIFTKIQKENEQFIASIKSKKVNSIGIATILVHHDVCSYCILAYKLDIKKKPINEIIKKISDPFKEDTMIKAINDVLGSVKHIPLKKSQEIHSFLDEQRKILSEKKLDDVIAAFNNKFNSKGNFFICPINSLKISDILEEVFKHQEFINFIFGCYNEIDVDVSLDKDRRSWIMFGSFYGDYKKFSSEEKTEITEKIFAVINSIRKAEGKEDLPDKLPAPLFAKYNDLRHKGGRKINLDSFGKDNSSSHFTLYVEENDKESAIKAATDKLLKDGRELISKATCSLFSPKYYEGKVTISLLLIEEGEKPKREQKGQKPKNEQRGEHKGEQKPKNQQKKEKEQKGEEKPENKQNGDKKPQKGDTRPIKEILLEEFNKKRNEYSCEAVKYATGALVEKANEFAKRVQETKSTIVKKELLESIEGYKRVQYISTVGQFKCSGKELVNIVIDHIIHNPTIFKSQFDQIAFASNSNAFVLLLGQSGEKEKTEE